MESRRHETARRRLRCRDPCGEALRKERVAYHIQGLDSNGELLEQAGSASDPFVVTMNKRFEGEPPHWPDSPPPESCEASCKSGSDCDEDEAYEGEEIVVEPHDSAGLRDRWFDQ